MRYPHTVTIEAPTVSADGGGGEEVTGWTAVYSGRADVQDMQDLDALSEAGLDATQFVTVFLPETASLSAIEKGHRLTWKGSEGTIYALSRLDNHFVAALNE